MLVFSIDFPGQMELRKRIAGDRDDKIIPFLPSCPRGNGDSLSFSLSSTLSPAGKVNSSRGKLAREGERAFETGLKPLANGYEIKIHLTVY